ncbi:unnamed protein product [Candida verbasci]|uniref:Uncharacterized protein n=1 Tax=Candida verbasci TaxID=1227364 RepID=A0A9W4TUA1_9ASCO|nr:unnamed protein product [Candida verbasci]
MSDFAFNNYCIHCDKECPLNSIYCSDECYSLELKQSSNDSKSRNSSNASISSNEAKNTNTTESELVSPLLTPALYLQQQQQQIQHIEESDDYDLNYFDLNYSVNANINYTKSTTTTSNNSNQVSQDLLNSTSHNYRKWLTTTAL